VGHLELRGEGFVKALELVRTGRIKNWVLVIRQEIGALLLGKLTWGMLKSISFSDYLYLDTPYVGLYTRKN